MKQKIYSVFRFICNSIFGLANIFGFFTMFVFLFGEKNGETGFEHIVNQNGIYGTLFYLIVLMFLGNLYYKNWKEFDNERK